MRWIRRIHLYAGLLMFPWVLLYGFTALLFNHSTLLPGPDTTIHHFQAPAPAGDGTPAATAMAKTRRRRAQHGRCDGRPPSIPSRQSGQQRIHSSRNRDGPDGRQPLHVGHEPGQRRGLRASAARSEKGTEPRRGDAVGAGSDHLRSGRSAERGNQQGHGGSPGRTWTGAWGHHFSHDPRRRVRPGSERRGPSSTFLQRAEEGQWRRMQLGRKNGSNPAA